MYLKRIELSGFKTFPDLTEVILSSGVTAVVGPNGCGKSNLMDAVRWVLGEQRPRVLRGARMEEVIFGGTPQRPGMSAAEVTLVIDNQSGRLPTEFAEVAVTRLLDRSGESEYRLNGTPCRLKDFADLFLDTGMGSHGYAVIQAGMIDAILSENPDERRFLFEEAAGVSKYKVRQKAALRKMEATDQDLLRLTDLKNEVATHVRSLARQKGTADRHRTLRDKWRAVEVAQASRAYRRLGGEVAALQGRHVQARDTALGLSARCDTLELESQALRLDVDSAERTAQTVADQLAEATAAWHTQKTEQVRLEDRRRHLGEDRARGSERQTALTTRLGDVTARRDRASAQHADELARQEQTAVRLRELDAEYKREVGVASAAEADHRKVQQAFDEAHQVWQRVASQEEAARHHRGEIERQRDLLGERLGQQRALVEQTEREAARLKEALAGASAELDSARDQANSAQTRLTELETARTRQEAEREHSARRLSEWRSERAEMASLIAGGEGLGRGAAQVLSNRERWNGRVSAWIDRLRPQAEWRHCIEMVLADRLGALWCADAKIAAALVAWMQSDPKGRAAILDPSLRMPNRRPKPEISAREFSGWLAEKVDCDNENRPWVEAILGDVAIATSGDGARTLYQALGGGWMVASQNGLVISPPGIVWAGSEGTEPVMGRADRLKGFDEKIALAEQSLERSESEGKRLTAEIESGRATHSDQQSRCQVLGNRVASVRLDLEAHNARLNEYRRRVDEFVAELGDRGQADNQLAFPERSEGELKRIRDGLWTKVQASESAMNDARERQQRAGAALNDARVQVVEAQARVDAAATDIRQCDDMMSEIRTELSELTIRLKQIEMELAGLEQEALQVAAAQQQLSGRCRELETTRAEARGEAARRKEILAQQEQQLREVRHQRDVAAQNRSQIEIELSGSHHEADQLRRRTLDMHQVDLGVQAIDDPAGSDDELKEQATSLLQSIERLGPVNPLALEEYEREKQRWDFLERQVGDLRQARTSLADTIAELNRTAGERFMATFESARTNFQTVFTELFRGGEADVRLIDPDQPLESPIEVFVRPRGKKFIGIRQLSGGERALTALALLFGLYLVKPSPFCILDEVDAPLDDANCGRFLRLIDRFKVKTQFIVVTHNKLTMEAADVLYGVTMEQPGVSRIVSVRLNRAGENGDEQPGLAEPRFEMAANEAAKLCWWGRHSRLPLLISKPLCGLSSNDSHEVWPRPSRV
ncbi:MAG: chromosome segregation protein SMC [candidate division Zixibacteria bacterium]|nr:chromosome segregation protein SMC [candidate division Zixibacteria bacterium]